MRLPEPSSWQFLSGIGLLSSAFLVAVGSGMNIDVEHDQEHRWIVRIAGILAFVGLVLLWLSLRRPSQDRGGPRQK